MAPQQPPTVQETGRLRPRIPPGIAWKVAGFALIWVVGLAFFLANRAPSTVQPPSPVNKPVIDQQTPKQAKSDLEQAARSGIQQQADAAAQAQNQSPWLSNLRGVFVPGQYQNMGPGGTYNPYANPYGNPYAPPQQSSQSPVQSQADIRKQVAEQAQTAEEERIYKASKAPLLVHLVEEEVDRPGLKDKVDNHHQTQLVATPAKQEPAPAEPKQQMYTLYQGHWIDTTLINGLNAAFAGPFEAKVGQDVYDFDRTVVLMKKGTRFLGMAEKLSAEGQERVVVKFTRFIREDKFSMEFPEMPGLNQQGESALKDKVNHHYVRTFTMTAAMGLIAGFSLANTQGGYNYEGSDAYRQGLSMAIGRSATRILDYFLHLPWDVYIRPGHRVTIYIMKDMQIPAQEVL